MSVRVERKEGSSITYYINEEKRTVVATLPITNLLDNFFNDCLKYEMSMVCDRGIDVIRAYGAKNFVGVAKCSPEDTFDAETGKSIAAARMLKRYYKVRLEAFRAMAEYYDRQLTACEDFMNHSWMSYNNHNNVIKNIWKSEEEN